jgi:hypothetical protein
MKILLILFLILSLNAYADCDMNYVDNAYFKVDLDDTISKKPKDIIFNHISKSSNCKIKFTKIKCTQITTQTFPVCVLETQFGYFTVITDYLNTMHVVYARWD